MRRSLITLMVFAMAFGFVSVDLSALFSHPEATIEFGVQDAEARRGGGFGGRSSFRPSRPAPRPAAKPAAKPSPKPASQKPAAKPASQKRDAATKAAARQQSQYRMSAAPKSTITSSSGRPIQVAGTSAAKTVRTMSADRYATRTSRQQTYYRNIPTTERTVIINRYGGGYYGDPFSGLFMYSLLSWSLYDQALFHHHHWDSYSVQRQQELLAENAALKAQMATLTGTPRDPNYTPAGTDSDLMYSDEFVQAAYNPAPVKKGSAGYVVLWVLGAFALAGLTWFVFFRRTNVSSTGW